MIVDIPRLYTGIAEFGSVLVYVMMLQNKYSKRKTISISIVFFVLQILVQEVAGILPNAMWIIGMMVAFYCMYKFIKTTCNLNVKDGVFLTIRAIVMAEFTAALVWYIYCYMFYDSSYLFRFLFVCSMYFVVFSIRYLVEKRHMRLDGRLNVTDKNLFNSIVIFVAVFIMSNLSFVYQGRPFTATMSNDIFYIRTLVNLSGLLMLYAQQEQLEENRLKNELMAIDIILQKQYENYIISKKNDDLINRKYHDLKHQVEIIRKETDIEKREKYLEEIDLVIKQHDAKNETGNEILDTILYNKSMECVQYDINFSYMADGTVLEFMDVMDLCTIFGNALDNAIESVKGIGDKDKRIISMSVFAQNAFVIMRFENYCENKVDIIEGMPQTTKKNKDNHGFGVKSIDYAVKKYNGSITVSLEQNWFSLCALIPIKTK